MIKKLIILFHYISFILFTMTLPGLATCEGELQPQQLSKQKIVQIEDFIRKQMKTGKIPGMAVAIVQDGSIVYKKGFGYANLKTRQPVTPNTLFELGSNSKAFTALAVLKLAKEGRLDTKEHVSTYLPWFRMRLVQEEKDPTFEYLRRYLPWLRKTEKAGITLEQLLTHTSGIRAQSIAYIRPSRRDDALEETVKTLVGKELNINLYYPGHTYLYATINYDVLGLIIQEISGLSYEEYLKRHILQPMGLNRTFLFREEAEQYGMATGYKIGFLRQLPYKAPVYRGNVPAGYIISNANDMARWLRLQLGTEETQEDISELINESHQTSLDYNYGWLFYRTSHGMRMWHGGSNPNFSSYVELWPEQQTGIVLLANTNSSLLPETGESIINMLRGKGRVPDHFSDYLLELDLLWVILITGLFFGSIVTWRAVTKLYNKKRKFMGVNRKNQKVFMSFCLLPPVFFTLLFLILHYYFDFRWAFEFVWAPASFPLLVFLMLIEGVLLYLFLFNKLFYHDVKMSKDQKPVI